MRDVNPIGFFDLFLQMCWTNVVGSIGFEDQLFSSFIEGFWFSSRPLYFGIVSHLFELGDELVHSLTCYLEIPSNLDNRLFLDPVSDDPLNIPIR